MTSASLGGVPLTVPTSGITWSLRKGTSPSQHVFVTTKERARKILARAQTQFRAASTAASATKVRKRTESGPLTLRISARGYKPLIVKHLFAVETLAVDENNLGIVVVDRRWLWRREHVLRDYNLRRRTGNYRLLGGALSPIEVKISQPDFVFKRITLDNGVRWTAQSALKDMLLQLAGQGGFRVGNLPLFRDIQDLEIDDNGAGALMRLLAYIPGAEVYVDLDGTVVVYNSLDGSEGAAVKASGNPYPGGQVEFVDRSLVRPKTVASLFDIEPEIRFDFTELLDTQTRTTPVPGREPRELQNVLPVVDPELVVDGKTVARNTWLPAPDWFASVSALASEDANIKKAGFGNINQALIRKHYLSGMVHLRNKFILAEQGVPSPLWSTRFDAVQAYWRSAFRILPQWMDKLKSIRAIRASILDQETGTRGKAEAFFDYTVRPSQRTIAKNYKDKADAAWSITGYAADLTDAAPGPADVVVLEPEDGVFQLLYRIDPWGNSVKLAPGKLLGPVPAQSAGEAALAWNSTKVELAPSWQVAVILTVSLAAPNNQTRLHAEIVSKAEALRLLPGVANQKALGPTWKMRVGAGIETVRYAWVDSSAAAIEDAIFSDKPFPRDLMVNREHVRAIAEANAARIQSFLLDRWQGEQVVSINADVKPTGSLAIVTHIVTQDGAQTHLDLPPITMPPDIFALLPDSTRKVIQRQVQP